MSGILAIMWKEIRDNLRDKRSVFFALLYGPLLMPMLSIGPMVVQSNKHMQSYDQGKELHVYAPEKAPNLVSFLRSKNLDVTEVDSDFIQQIQDDKLKLVVEVSELYGERLLEGKPAKVTIHYLDGDQDSKQLYWQIRAELDNYGRTIASQRMMVRGFDQTLLKPIDIAENNLSEEQFQTGFLATLVMFLLVFSCMMGGFYLAIDITSGERERLSLEPLLSLPLTRSEVALGKYMAILAFCSVSMLLPLVTSAIMIFFLPQHFFKEADIPGLITWVKMIVLVVPVCLVITGVLMVIAAWSKSIKEAQTQLSLVMFVLMSPMFVVSFFKLKPDPFLNLVPILSQYFSVGKIMTDASYSVVGTLPGALSCLLLAMALLGVAIQLYKKDSILGN